MDDNSDDLYTIGAEFIENLLQENVGVVSELKSESEKSHKPRNSNVYITEK